MDARDDGAPALIRPNGRTLPSPRAALGSLLLHAALLAVAVLLARGAPPPAPPEPVHLALVRPVPAEAEELASEDPGGGGPDEPALATPSEPAEREPPTPRAPRREIPRTTISIDEPREEPDAGTAIARATVDAVAASTGAGVASPELGTRLGGPGSGGGSGTGTGTGTGPGTGAGTAPIYLPVGMERPRLLSTERPLYTRRAREADARGDVVVRIHVGADGRVRDVTPISGHPVLREEVLRVVRQWRYTPPRLRGRPTPIYMIQRITFEQR